MLNEFKELEAKHFLVAVLTALASVGPGFLSLYHFRPELIASLDVIKLLIFSVSLTLPLALLNCVIVMIPLFGMTKSPESLPPAFVWAFGNLVTATVCYAILYAAYIWHLTFRQYAYAVVFIEMASLLVCILVVVIHNGIKKRTSNKSVEDTVRP